MFSLQLYGKSKIIATWAVFKKAVKRVGDFALAGLQTHKSTILAVSGEGDVPLRYWLSSLWPSGSTDII